MPTVCLAHQVLVHHAAGSVLCGLIPDTLSKVLINDLLLTEIIYDGVSINNTDELALVLPEEFLNDIIVNLCGSCIGSMNMSPMLGGGAQVLGYITQ